MSEVVYSSNNIALPRGYEKLDGLELVKQKDGDILTNGLIELGEGDTKTERRVQLPDPIEMWGYDPAEYEIYKADPEKWELKRRVEALEQWVGELAVQNEALTSQVLELQTAGPPREGAENSSNGSTTSETSGSIQPGTLLGVNSVEDSVASTSGVWSDQRGDKWIRVKEQSGKEKNVRLSDVIEIDESREAEVLDAPEPESNAHADSSGANGNPTVAVSQFDEPDLFERVGYQIRRIIPGKTQAPERATVVDEDEIVEERYKDRKTGRAVAIGATALAALAIGIGLGFSLDRDDGKEGKTQTATTTAQPNQGSSAQSKIVTEGGAMVVLPDSAGGQDLSNHNINSWNPNSKSTSVAVVLPKGYTVAKSSTNGYHKIVKNGGTVITSRLKMTETGAVSQGSLDELKKKGLTKIGQTYLTYYDNTGPTNNPKLPSAKNPGLRTHTVTILGKA